MVDESQFESIKDALQLLIERCPRLATLCYWAGTSCIAMEELRHRLSFDLDFHTRKALQDVRPILAEIRTAFGRRFELIRAPDEFGSGFQGVLKFGRGKAITVEVLSNYEDVPSGDLTAARSLSGLKRVSLRRYLADKIQCVVERTEARDLVDIQAILRKQQGLKALAKRIMARQDALLMAERLLAWTDASIRNDLKAYPDVDPRDAIETRDCLLEWVKSSCRVRRAK